MVKAGFGISDISPLVGTPMAGYLQARYVSGVHDPLFARALALNDGATSAVVISFDLIAMADEDVVAIQEAVARRVPAAPQNVLLFSTHTHTGPSLVDSFETPRGEEYAATLPDKAARAAETAWHDLAEASVSFVEREVTGVAFERRYLMKDGSIRTNPGRLNPDIVRPRRQIRTPVTLLAFERDATRLPIVIASFPCHADVVGGTEVSADFPGRLCDHLTHRLPGHPETLFLRAPAGDINHINVCEPSDQGGYDHAKKMADMITSSALTAWGDRESVPGGLFMSSRTVTVERRPIEQTELAAARSLFAQSKNISPLPEEAIWARETLLLAEMPEQLPVRLEGLRIGDFSVVGIPGELFSELADEIQDRSPAAKTLVLDCCGGDLGYIPPRGVYGQDGYEERPARSSRCAPGSGEAIAESAVELLAALA